MINLGEAKKVTFKTLLENNIKDYQFEGLSLLSKILELDTKTVITENNIEISLEQKYLIEKITKKRIEGMPLAYLTKEKLFFNETFYVDKNVLIPRHETEELIDCFFSLIEKENLKNKRILDVGTGGGFPGIILAIYFQNFNFHVIIFIFYVFYLWNLFPISKKGAENRFCGRNRLF